MQQIFRNPHNADAPWLPREYMLESEAEIAALPVQGVPAGSVAYTVNNSVRLVMGADGQWHTAVALPVYPGSAEAGLVASLTSLPLTSGRIIEAVGVPPYVDDVTDYADYGLTETGWYVFARITAPAGAAVTSGTTVTGAEGSVITPGADHVDVAVKFDTAAQARVVTVHWGAAESTYVFRAVDLAVRNLDYRSTFYVYDAAPYVTWSHAQTTDAAFDGAKTYYKRDGQGGFAALPLIHYYVAAEDYALTTDATFREDVTYYTRNGDVYTEAEVVPGETVPANTYYVTVTVYVQTQDATFQAGTVYYLKEGEEYVAAEVDAGAPVPLYPGAAVPPAYYEHAYALTADAAFVSGKTYYTEEGGVYTEAAVTAGDPVPPETYYEDAYAFTEDETFQAGKTYYTQGEGGVYAEAEVDAEAEVPAFFLHSKLTFAGMARNITYRLDETVDCPTEFILPEIEDNTHGAWFEIQLRHAGAYSMTLVPPEGVKIATEHTQAETAGMNMIDLHYLNIDGVKLWRFMNTHSTIPTA